MKMCFLSLNSYPLIAKKNLGYAGGAEVEQVHLGTEFVAHGHNVCFVTYFYGSNQIENVCGIEVIKTYNRETSSETNVLLKYKSIWSALEKANADIYFHEAGALGILPLFCYLHNKKFVYRIPSDATVLSKSLSGNYGFDKRIVDAVEIRRADFVIAQSEFQKRLLMERFGVKSVVIKNGLIVPEVECHKSEPPVVLWVGSLSEVKNPELFVELAKTMPNALFEMVGNSTGDRELYENVKREAKKSANFKYNGFVPYPEVNDYFKRASIFVNTSRIEGFPNTFIQAWVHHTPVVSLAIDPDDIIQNEKLGFHSGTFKQLVSDVNTLLQNEKLRETMGENGRKYAEREHDVRKTVKEYIRIFDQLLT